GTFPFGWDSTPAIWKHDHTYSIVLKDNHYFDQLVGGGPFYITQLSADLQIEWQYRNVETQSCTRHADGSALCSDVDINGLTHPNGFEGCVNAPAIDRDGNVQVNSEDGNVYILGQGGFVKERIFLQSALSAAYTPTAIDPRGRIYALNNGDMFIL